MFQAKIEKLQALKSLLTTDTNTLLETAHIANKWFTIDNIHFALQAIIDNFLSKDNLESWLKNYEDSAFKQSVAIIAAGNIPMVSFHDLLCCFITNANTQIKLSSKDEILMQHVIKLMQEVDPAWQVEITERLKNYDKVIATGSNNTNRYFEYYFANVPSILRKNRTSIAVLNGSETNEELSNLADDVFMYFGMGCRNVSSIWLEKGSDVTKLFPAFEKYNHLADHKLYMDNYDYNRTLLLMNQTKHLANEFAMLKEEDSLYAKIATVHYRFYENEEEVQNFIIENHENLQCVVSQPTEKWQSVNFGETQQPSLASYADNVDTMAFLLR